MNETDKIRVIVSPNNEFSVDVTVTNDGMDTSLGSVFDIVVPDQIEVSAAVSLPTLHVFFRFLGSLLVSGEKCLC